MEYTQIDKEGQLSMVRARIRELETQHMDLSIRLQSPGPGATPGGFDNSNLQQLENSLAKLRQMEQELSASGTGT